MAGNPHDQGGPGPTRDSLLDLGNGAPTYNTGQRPPVDDTQLLQRYDIDDRDEAQPRPSTSYDDFVGGGRPQVPPNGQSNEQQPGRPFTAPYMDGGTRTYSQTSDLNNFSRYADEAGDDDSAYNKYYDGARCLR